MWRDRMKKFKYICRECRDNKPCKLTTKFEEKPKYFKPTSCVLTGAIVKWEEVKK